MNDSKLRIIMHTCPTYVGIQCCYQIRANIVVVPCLELITSLGLIYIIRS